MPTLRIEERNYGRQRTDYSSFKEEGVCSADIKTYILKAQILSLVRVDTMLGEF